MPDPKLSAQCRLKILIALTGDMPSRKSRLRAIPFADIFLLEMENDGLVKSSGDTRFHDHLQFSLTRLGEAFVKSAAPGNAD